MYKLLVILLLCSPVDRPSVFRVTAFEATTNSLGTGTCIATANHQSLVITANHVIQDGRRFKVGDYSAKVIIQNKIWDLAALVVDETLPVTVIRTTKPTPGMKLTFCGFGSGNYLEGTGEVNSQFFSPGGTQPQDIIAISVQARSGDSGGPILDAEGRLAAVLFGSDSKIGAHGSHCVRVRWFIEQIEGYPLLKQDALHPMILFGR